MGKVSLVDGHIDGMTNYDRIRNMSVDELAEFIDYSVWEAEDFNKIIDKKVLYGVEDVKQWLESEVDTK
jgi:hypothetical protein